VAAIAFVVDGLKYALQTDSDRAALQSDSASGFVDAREIYERPTRRIPLRWPEATDAEVFQIRELWDESLGGVLRMDWTPIDGSAAFEVRFVGPPSITFHRAHRDQYQVSCELEEAL